MNRFGIKCPVCPDALSVLTTNAIQISVEDPASGESLDQAEHTGPTVVAPVGHIMVVHRGVDETVTVREGQIVSLCAGDVVRVLTKSDD